MKKLRVSAQLFHWIVLDGCILPEPGEVKVGVNDLLKGRRKSIGRAEESYIALQGERFFPKHFCAAENIMRTDGRRLNIS